MIDLRTDWIDGSQLECSFSCTSHPLNANGRDPGALPPSVMESILSFMVSFHRFLPSQRQSRGSEDPLCPLEAQTLADRSR